MDSDCGSYLQEKPNIALKSSQIHVERLKKLKSKLPFQTPQTSQYTPSRGQSFINTKFSISRQTCNNLNPFDQCFKRQENTAPNKSNYFQSMNLKNIQSQNKILYKKIQKIVKRKTTNLILQQKHQQRNSNTTFHHNEEQLDNDVLNVTSDLANATSDLAENMIKNRATRSMIKQQEIRNENLKMLQRLMSLKPTIETRKILSQTRKQQQISKRMSKFNSLHTVQLQKGDSQKEQSGNSMNIFPKRLSVDNSQNYHNKNETQYEIPINLTKKQHISSYQQRTYRLTHESSVIFKRTNTEPIQSLQKTKLPTLSSNHATNVYSFKDQENSQECMRKRARSQNIKYLQTSKSFSSGKPQFQTTTFGYRSNSTQSVNENNAGEQINLFKARKALDKQKVLSDKQIHKGSPKKFILLAEIERKVHNLNVRFRFVRFNCYYEIQIRQKKAVKKDQKNEQTSNKSKPSNPLSHQPTPSSSQPLGLRKIPYQKASKPQTTKKLKFPGGIISLDEQMGSALFSSFDYDYHRIVQKCLSFDIGKDRILNIGMRQEFKECSKRIIAYQQDSIRQNDQDEEEDSVDSVRQE